MPDIPIPDNFKGKVIKPGDDDYEAQCYQYASSSYLDKGIVKPAVIIKAADESDVIKAIKYASDNKIAVAVRTGGHQYSGASSTYGNNIQLDLSQTYKEFKWDDEGCTSVTFGVSYSLIEFNAKLREKNRFVPHGQCQYVNMGGHIQTGGYGMLSRSFGLLSDFVKKFRIITADGKVQWIDKKNNSELFFAVLGGSPGNFGVLTNVTLNVFRDQDYPNSRGLRAVYPYKRQCLKALLDVMVEVAEDDNFPADYDYSISVLSEPKITTDEATYDMIHNVKGNRLPVVFPPVIAVFVQWANLQGDRQTYNPNFIDKIRQVAGKGQEINSDNEYTPMSTLTGHWLVPMTREFNLPYIKRTYSSNSSSQRLKDLKWTDWISNRFDVGRSFSLSAQFFVHGGSKSRFFQNGKNSPTSLSWRDTSFVTTLDAFHHSYQYEQATKWVQGNDEGVGNPEAAFCEHDRRLLWGSYDLDLSANQQYYYDQYPEGKYERLCQIKKKYDPFGVFTPNRFCIGLPVTQPAEIQPRINLADSKTAKKEVAAMKLEVKSEVDIEKEFWAMASMKREVDKPVLLWDHWRS